MSIRRNYPTTLKPFQGATPAAAVAPPPTQLPSGVRKLVQSAASPQKLAIKQAPVAPPPIHRSIVPPSGNDGYVKYYRHFGVQVHVEGNQLRGQCPFPDCQKEDHFYASFATGQWDCKRCGRDGNAWTFLSQFHTAGLNLTTEQDYIDFSEQRPGIEPWVFKEWQLARNPLTAEWMLPAWSMDKKLSNLYQYRQLYDANKQQHFMTIMSACQPVRQIVYGLQKFRTDHERPVYVLEGHWDTLAFDCMAAYVTDKRTGKMLCDVVDFLGVPGAGNFPQEWLSLLNDRDVRLCYDNDEPGKKGIEKTLKAIAENGTIPRRIGVLEWPEGYASGYDVRDLIHKGVQAA